MGGGLGVLGSTQQKLYSQAVKGLNAIPVVGPALSQIAGSILNIIDKHHAAALAAEGKALNDATPRMIQTFAMIVQAAATGEIRDQGTANDLADKTVALFYGEVKPIQRGNWPYTGKDMTADYVKVWLKRFQPPANAPGYSDYHAPDPCNAACVIGHFFAERNAWLVKYAVADILAGNHGVVTFPQIPAYATQQGYPEMDVSY
jgi:hypothetical protein